MSELVAKGEIELGMVVITQIMTTPGVELVGPLPSEIQSYITFTAGVSANAQAPDAARELLKLLQGPNALPVQVAGDGALRAKRPVLTVCRRMPVRRASSASGHS